MKNRSIACEQFCYILCVLRSYGVQYFVHLLKFLDLDFIDRFVPFTRVYANP